MASLSRTETFFVVHCALLVLTLVTAAVVGFSLFWLARRRKDPARTCLVWAKFAVVFFMLFCFTEFCSDAVWIAFSRITHMANEDGFTTEYEFNMLATLLQARIELASISRFTDQVLFILCWMTVITLGVGVNIVRTGEPARHDKYVKAISLSFAGILGCLAAAEWGIKIAVYVTFDTDKYDLEAQGERKIMLLNVARKLDFAFVTTAWVASIATLVRSTWIWIPSRKDKRLDWPLLYLMLCCGTLLIRTTYELIYQLKFIDIDDIRDSHAEPAYIELIEVVFQTWSIFAITIMLLILGAKKRGGLWSTPQPFLQESETEGSQDIRLENIHVDPPAYSATPSSNSQPRTDAEPAAPGSAAAAHSNPGACPPQAWQQVSTQHETADNDLVEGLGLGGTPERYRPPIPQDDGYNSGIVAPVLPADAGPAHGYEMGMPSQPPPEHEEIMGLNHQADGRPPVSEPLPYPEKN